MINFLDTKDKYTKESKIYKRLFLQKKTFTNEYKNTYEIHAAGIF